VLHRTRQAAATRFGTLRDIELTPAQMDKAVTALLPFVHEWRLSLNPEDLHELAYAVLMHFDSEAPFEAIDAAVRDQIADARRPAEKLYRTQAEDPSEHDS